MRYVMDKRKKDSANYLPLSYDAAFWIMQKQLQFYKENGGCLKQRINNFLFPMMKGQMTLDEFEQIAIQIHEILADKVSQLYE